MKKIKYVFQASQSKENFCGRTQQFNQLITWITTGDHIAIFGERKIGKTLLQLMLNDVINGLITRYESELIDKNFQKYLLLWKKDLANFISIYVDLQGTYSESEINSRIMAQLNKLNENQLNFNIQTPIDNNTRFEHILQHVSDNCRKINKHFVILFDEMEELGTDNFIDSDSITKKLRMACIHFDNLVFICAGSFNWLERIGHKESSPLNQYRECYLGPINHDDAKKFLITPIESFVDLSIFKFNLRDEIIH
ncbi:MAG: hypothetical protein GF353_29500, partial [Candidatus Lokiarchaeota archaeon]|nr:hypothetical protein [Candidatus Lokiarchaeota archaeon]